MTSASKEDYEEKERSSPTVLNVTNAALWGFDIGNQELRYSEGFYSALGFEPYELDGSYAHFINNILYHEDVSLLLNEAYNCTINASKNIEIRLFTKQGFQWFQNCFTRQSENQIIGALVNINQFKLSELQLLSENRLYATGNKIARSGTWEIDVHTRSLILSKEVDEILEVSESIHFSIGGFIRFFSPEHRPIVTDSLNNSIETGKPFDLDLQLKTSHRRVIWVKFKALAMIDAYGKCVKVKGILQNIDDLKQKESELRSSFAFIEHQNKRLQNFAYIVSHNLRSHANNLQYLVRLHQETSETGEQQEIFSHINTISNSLNTTIEHLNQVVKIEADIQQEKQLVELEPLFKNIINALKSNIQNANVTLEYDFSACPTVLYLPAYLESIFQNLLTNAIKYRHPERQPTIKCESRIVNDDVYLTFEDNGIGIDLERYGKKIFGLYQAFHNHPDSQGIGLYITRNQVEALGGSILVESVVDKGTKFTIRIGRKK
jgi:signal transduction histidine kinase